MNKPDDTAGVSPDGLTELHDPAFDKRRVCRVHLYGISHEGTICDATTDQMLYLARTSSDRPAIIGILISSIERIEWEV